jgi:hypothetical protein
VRVRSRGFCAQHDAGGHVGRDDDRTFFSVEVQQGYVGYERAFFGGCPEGVTFEAGLFFGGGLWLGRR